MTGIKWAVVLVSALGAIACGNDNSPAPKGDGGGGHTGWMSAVGDQGTFVQTKDAAHWQTNVVAKMDLTAVTCAGNRDGWAVGAQGAVLRTYDGGASWSAQDAHTSATLRAVHFAIDSANGQRLVGVAAGDSGTLVTSLDGGGNWSLVTTHLTTSLRGASSSMAAELFVVVGDGATLLRSSDLGASWETQTLAGAADLRAVAVRADGSLVLVTDSAGHVFASKDLAKSFALERTEAAALNAVALAHNGSRAIVAGAGGKVARRDASGVWTALESGTSQDLFGVLIASEGGNDLLAGANGTLLASVDQGASWVPQHIDTQLTLRAVDDLGED